MKNNNQSYGFVSFSWKRCIAGLLLFLIGLHDLLIFSPLSGRHVPTGSIMTFEGPSYFLSTGLIPFLSGIGLLLYSLLSYFRGSIENSDTTLKITEKRRKKQIISEINKEKIEAMELSNNKIGIKYLWLFLFIPYFIINYYYMILNFNQPFVDGLVNGTAMVILVTLIIAAISLQILFFMPQWLLEIYTTDGYHQLWFEPFEFRNSRMIVDQIARQLEIVMENQNEISIGLRDKTSLGNFVLSVFFLGYGIFNIVAFMTTMAIFQSIICHVLIIGGIYLISEELRSLPIKSIETESKTYRYNLKSRYYQRYLYVKSSDVQQDALTHVPLDVFWGLLSAIVFIVIPFKIIQILMVINDTNAAILIDNAVILTLFGILIMSGLAYYLLIPRERINFKGINLKITETMISAQERGSNQMISNIKNSLKRFKKNFESGAIRKAFLKRVLFIALSALIGMMVLFWQYFFYFNVFNIFNI